MIFDLHMVLHSNQRLCNYIGTRTFKQQELEELCYLLQHILLSDIRRFSFVFNRFFIMNETLGSENKYLCHLIKLSELSRTFTTSFQKVIENHLMNEYLVRTGKKLTDLEILNKTTILKSCRWCLITWQSDMFKVIIEPQKNRGKSLCSWLNKKSNGLNKYQRKFVKRCKKNQNENYLVVQCNVCHKKTKLPLHKPERINNIDEIVADKIKRKKKKKKKDLYAGLNPKIMVKTMINDKSMNVNNVKLTETDYLSENKTVPIVPDINTDSINKTRKTEKRNNINEVVTRKKKNKKNLYADLNPKIMVKTLINDKTQEANNVKLTDQNMRENKTVPRALEICTDSITKKHKVNSERNNYLTIVKSDKSSRKNKLKIKRLLNENKNNNFKQKPKKRSLLASFLESL
ncbi:uncharacterized protein LOC142319340 [Lycorma delicatula]|uniref:uncharacterized protein LOC142319340 n=1 Tax=Lycorma delicatula TaxID=130591 RepID=UPI003F519075